MHLLLGHFHHGARLVGSIHPLCPASCLPSVKPFSLLQPIVSTSSHETGALVVLCIKMIDFTVAIWLNFSFHCLTVSMSFLPN